MSKNCIECGSYAINHHCHGRDGSDGELCDVCYWRKRADELDKPTMLVIKENKDLKHRCDELLSALEFVMSAHGEQLDSAFAQAQNAISKAKGV